MPSPRKSEQKKDYISRCMSSEEAKRDFPDSKQRVAFCNSKWENKSKGAYEYEDPKTGELFYYSRRGVYRKKGRTLIFKKRTRGETMSDHILNRTSESYADKKAGYPPNCNEGYVEKDGKCVSVKKDAVAHNGAGKGKEPGTRPEDLKPVVPEKKVKKVTENDEKKSDT